jgi:vacuolar-type H+-ATPase subunit I/STV1
VYLSQLGLIAPLGDTTVAVLKNLSFGIMILALVLGAGIVLKALVTGMIEHRRQHEMLEEPLAAD